MSEKKINWIPIHPDNEKYLDKHCPGWRKYLGVIPPAPEPKYRVGNGIHICVIGVLRENSVGYETYSIKSTGGANLQQFARRIAAALWLMDRAKEKKDAHHILYTDEYCTAQAYIDGEIEELPG